MGDACVIWNLIKYKTFYGFDMYIWFTYVIIFLLKMEFGEVNYT